MRLLSVQFLGKLQGNWNGLTWSLYGVMLQRSQDSGKTSQDSISHELNWNYFNKNSPIMFKQGCSVLMLSSSCAFTLVPFLLLLCFDFYHIFYCMMIGLSRNLICTKVWRYWSIYKRPHATRQTKVYSKISLNSRKKFADTLFWAWANDFTFSSSPHFHACCLEPSASWIMLLHTASVNEMEFVEKGTACRSTITLLFSSTAWCIQQIKYSLHWW